MCIYVAAIFRSCTAYDTIPVLESRLTPPSLPYISNNSSSTYRELIHISQIYIIS